jgi:hypothetical protein
LIAHEPDLRKWGAIAAGVHELKAPSWQAESFTANYCPVLLRLVFVGAGDMQYELEDDMQYELEEDMQYELEDDIRVVCSCCA